MLLLADVHTTQLRDPTSSLDELNCTCAVGATGVKWHYRDRAPAGLAAPWPVTAGRVRAEVREPDGDADVIGGTNLPQVAEAIGRVWRVPMIVVDDGSFDDAWDLAGDPDVFVALGIQYTVLDGTPYDAGGAFLGAHATGFARASLAACDFTDPLADGRRPGIPNGVQRMGRTLLKSAAAALEVNRKTGKRAGWGRAWYAWVRALPAVTPPNSGGDRMFNVGPIVTERDAILAGAPGDPVILYRDAALTVRHSAVAAPVALGFLGSTAEAHVVVNAGWTNYVRRSDVSRIIANRRTYE